MIIDYQYRVGGSLAYNHPTYVSRQADRELLSALLNGKFAYVFNCRQMGKSSLRVRVTSELQAMGMTGVSIDITSIGSDDNLSKWYNGIITRLFLGLDLTGKVNLKTWLKDREELPPVQRLSQFIEEVLTKYRSGERIFIFIDEIDKILSLPFSLDDFFASIRYCYNQRAENPVYNNLTFALFGVATPSDLIREKTQTSFNIGEAIELTGFTLEEAEPLRIGLREKFPRSREIMAEILNWTGGQPFLTQKLCRLLIENNEDLETIVRERVIHHWESNDEPIHFRTIADRILRNDRGAGRLLGLYRKILENNYIEYDDSSEQRELRLSGLVVKIDNKLSIYNSIYREIFNEKWVDSQLNKLRPYSEAIEAWRSSNFTDESTLLRGKTLETALLWSREKSLSDLDYQFLSASQNLEKREAEIRLEVERKANQILATANQKAKRNIKIGSIFLLFSFLGGFLAIARVEQALNELQEAKIGINLQRDGDTALRQFPVEPIESLTSALKAGIQLEELVDDGRRFPEYPATSPILALQQILDTIREKNQLEGHRGTIYSVSISPDGSKIATASEDGNVYIWNERGQKINALKGHKGAVYSVAFSPDGSKIATAGEDRTARIQDLKGNPLVILSGHERSVYSVNFSPDGRAIVTTSRDGTAKLWDLEGKLIRTLRGHRKSVDDASFSPDGREVATASRDGTVRLWDRETGELRLTLGKENTDAFYSVSFHPDGREIAAAAGDKTAKIWDRRGNLITTLAGHEDFVNSVSFSRTGDFLVTASSDGTARIWNRRGEILVVLRGHQESVFDAAVSADGKSIVTGSSDRAARIWNSGNLPRKSGESVDNSAVGIDPSGSTRAIATKDGNITLLDRAGKIIASFPAELSSIYSLAFSPDGEYIAAVGRKGEVRIWNRSGRLQTSFLAGSVPFYSVAFSPDGGEIFAGSSDGTIERWNWRENPPKAIGSFRADSNIIYDMALSPDGERLATAARGTVKVWDKTGNLLLTLARDSFPVYGVAFSPDGTEIATISRDGTARRWDRSGNPLAEYKIAPDIVYSIAFNPDGKTISIVSRDGTVTRWPVEPSAVSLEKLVDRGCDWLKDYLATRPEARKELDGCTGN